MCDVSIDLPEITPAEKRRIANLLRKYYNIPRNQIKTFPWPTRISIIESAGNVLLDLYMKPPFSEFSPKVDSIGMIRNGMETKSCVPMIEYFLANTNVLGYPLHYNLMVLNFYFENFNIK